MVHSLNWSTEIGGGRVEIRTEEVEWGGNRIRVICIHLLVPNYLYSIRIEQKPGCLMIVCRGQRYVRAELSG